MEILRLIPLIGFLLFCNRIFRNSMKLKQNGVVLSAKKPNLKTYISTFLLIAFFLLYTAQLITQTKLFSFTLLPSFLEKPLYQSMVLSFSGALIVFVSIVLINLTLNAFNNSLRFGVDSKNLGELVSTGVFAHSRNPFFISILLLFMGITMVFPTPFFIGIALLALVSIHFFILKEEQFMHNNYGEEYREYCKKVRRYF